MQATRSLRRASQLLRLLSTHTRVGWRLSDLADASGIDHSTVHRLLGELSSERLVTRVPGSTRYTLGCLTYELGLAAAPWFALADVAAPHLKRLANSTRTIAFMNLKSGADSVCIARHEGRPVFKAYTVEVGVRRPLSVSAGGVALLVALAPTQRETLLAQSRPALTRTAPARQAAIERMLRRSLRLGYGLNRQDIIPGIVAVGVALRDPAGAPFASISLATTATAFDRPRRAALLEQLTEAATRIEPLQAGLRF